MTSPINLINKSTTTALNNSASKTKDKPSSEEVAQPSSSTEDTVSISQETVHIRELQSQLSSVSEIDMDKVESIKQEISRGNYPVDTDRIAENLINLEKALAD